MATVKEQVQVILGLSRGARSGKLKLREEAPTKENRERVFAVKPFTPGDKGAISLLTRARESVKRRPDLVWTDPTDGNDSLLSSLWIGRKVYRSKESGYQTGKASFWFSVEPVQNRAGSAVTDEAI